MTRRSLSPTNGSWSQLSSPMSALILPRSARQTQRRLRTGSSSRRVSDGLIGPERLKAVWVGVEVILPRAAKTGSR